MTKTITHEGVEYLKVKRIAEVGDLITYNFEGEYDDIPREVTSTGVSMVEVEPFILKDNDDEIIGFTHDAYDVLEPIEPTPVEASPSVIDLLANISRRLYEVEEALKPSEPSEVDAQDETVDNVNSPQHYRHGRFETIELIEDITKKYDDGFVAYCVGNAVKYVDRAPFKHGSPSEDLRKAAWYLTRAAEHTDGKGAV